MIRLLGGSNTGPAVGRTRKRSKPLEREEKRRNTEEGIYRRGAA
jgi:hypothetical protein